jgi:hypothetical protein
MKMQCAMGFGDVGPWRRRRMGNSGQQCERGSTKKTRQGREGHQRDGEKQRQSARQMMSGRTGLEGLATYLHQRRLNGMTSGAMQSQSAYQKKIDHEERSTCHYADQMRMRGVSQMLRSGVSQWSKDDGKTALPGTRRSAMRSDHYELVYRYP